MAPRSPEEEEEEPAVELSFNCTEIKKWKESLSSYPDRIASLNKPNLPSLDEFYRNQLPTLIRSRDPSPHLTRSELSSLMQWKLTRGKFRPRLLDYVKSLEEDLVMSASEKAFLSLPDLSKAISELTVLKGVGPATASAVLAAFAPDVAPFMSDEAMVVALGSSKDYSLKQYLLFASKLQAKAKELSSDSEEEEEEAFTPSDVERALWSATIGAKLVNKPPPSKKVVPDDKKATRKRKKSG